MSLFPRHMALPEWFAHGLDKLLRHHENDIIKQFMKGPPPSGEHVLRSALKFMVPTYSHPPTSSTAATTAYNWTTSTSTATTYIDCATDLISLSSVPAIRNLNSLLPPGISISDDIHQSDDYSIIEIDRIFRGEIKLPDGVILKLNNGNYTIEDKDAKITYKGNRHREFNKFLTGSDLLEEFILDLAKLGVTQSEFMNLPVQAFITWLIYKAAEQDDEPHQFRCMSCGRFTAPGAIFCGGDHLKRIAQHGVS